MQDEDETLAPEAAVDVESDYDTAFEELANEGTVKEPDEPDQTDEPEDAADDDQPPSEDDAEDQPEEPKEKSKSPDDLAKAEQNYRTEIGRARASRERALRAAEELARLRETKGLPVEEEEDRLAAAKEEWGDVITPVAEEIASLKEQHRKDRADDMERREQSLQAEIEETAAREAAVFEREHSDGWDVLKQHGDTFREWVDDQPKLYRDIFHANEQTMTDGEGAALLLSRFKAELAAATAPPDDPPKQRLASRREKQLQGAQSVASRGRAPTSSEPSPSDDFGNEFDYWVSKEDTRR